MNQAPDPLRSPRYTVTEMARVAGLSPSSVRRWLLRNKDDGRHPLMGSFLEMVEMRMVAVLIKAGAKPRGLHEKVREAMKLSDPTRRVEFLIDGGDLWNKQDEVVTRLGAFGQLGLKAVVVGLSESIDVDATGLVRALYPEGRGVGIVMRPGICGGQPMLARSSKPTRPIALRVKAGDSREETAADFGVSVEDVDAAIAYEASLKSTRKAA